MTYLNQVHDQTKRLARGIFCSVLTGLAARSASAATTGGSAMPWEGPLNAVMESITGPTARIIAILIIVATGLTLAFGDVGQGFKKLLQILFGLAIAFAAATFFLPLVGGSGALVP